MGHQTLKQLFEQKRIAQLKEKLGRLGMPRRTLTEILDKQTLEQAVTAIKGLEQYKGNIDALDQIVNSVLTDVNNYITKAGGTTEKLLPVVQADEGTSPIIRALMLTNALEGGFQQLSTIVQNNIKGTNDPDTSEKTIIELLPSNDKQAAMNLQLTKAFSPPNTTEIPYLEGGGKKAFIDSLMNTPTIKLNAIARQVSSGRSSKNVMNTILTA